VKIEPYLFFDGNCEAAAEFYGKAIGAKVLAKMRYSESPETPPPGMVPSGYENKIMHMLMQIDDSLVMASDGCGNTPAFAGFSLTLNAADAAEARQKFAALSEGGKVTMPLDKTFFAEQFGMLTDRFGLGWMVIVAPQ
jgi:PhnB protein